MSSAICYIRVSTEEQALEGVSMEAQESRLKAYCASAGLGEPIMIREPGVSAGKFLANRNGGIKLLNAIQRGNVSHVVALKLDRLFRDAEDALHQTKSWDRAGVALHLLDLGGQAINTASAMGRFFLNMMAGFAELERNIIAERTTFALAHKKNSKQVYSQTPYGFDRAGDKLIPNHQEQQIISQIRKWHRRGWSLRKIANQLNSREIPTKKSGGKWHASTIRAIICNTLHENKIAE